MISIFSIIWFYSLLLYLSSHTHAWIETHIVFVILGTMALLVSKLLIFTVFSGVKTYTFKDEKTLHYNLFQSYNEMIRPALNDSNPIDVQIEFSLLTVHYLDMRNQVLSSSAIISVLWTDEFLKWNESLYGGLELIVIPSSKIWKPEVILENSLDNKNILLENDQKVVIKSNGHIIWRSQMNLKTYCLVDSTSYPFEVQNCMFNFSKLYFDDTYQKYFHSHNLSISNSIIENFISNGEWVIKKENIRQISGRKRRNGKYFTDIIWRIEMDRRQTYYVWSFLMPTVGLSAVSLVTFLLPVKSMEKSTISVFVFLSFAVIIRLFNESLPSTSDHISYFGILLSLNLGISGLAILVNSLISTSYHRKCPQSWLNCLLCKCLPYNCRRNVEEGRQTDDKVNQQNRPDPTAPLATQQIEVNIEMGDTEFRQSPEDEIMFHSTHDTSVESTIDERLISQTRLSDVRTSNAAVYYETTTRVPPNAVNVTTCIRENSVAEDIKKIKELMDLDFKNKNEYNTQRKQWSYVATSYDITFFVLFCMLYGATYIVVLILLFGKDRNIA